MYEARERSTPSFPRGSGRRGSLAADPAQLDPRVVVGEDLLVAVSALRHAVGPHLAHAHAVAEAFAGEEPARGPPLGGQALGGEERVGHVQGPADREAVDLDRLPVRAQDADLPHPARLAALQDLEVLEADAGE